MFIYFELEWFFWAVWWLTFEFQRPIKTIDWVHDLLPFFCKKKRLKSTPLKWSTTQKDLWNKAWKCWWCILLIDYISIDVWISNARNVGFESEKKNCVSCHSVNNKTGKEFCSHNFSFNSIFNKIKSFKWFQWELRNSKLQSTMA